MDNEVANEVASKGGFISDEFLNFLSEKGTDILLHFFAGLLLLFIGLKITSANAAVVPSAISSRAAKSMRKRFMSLPPQWSLTQSLFRIYYSTKAQQETNDDEKTLQRSCEFYQAAEQGTGPER